MKNVTIGILLCISFISVVGFSGDFKSFSSSQTMQIRTYNKQLVVDDQGRYVIVDLYSGDAKYVSNKESIPADSRCVKAAKNNDIIVSNLSK